MTTKQTKLGTHCGLCGKKHSTAYPGADVYCKKCLEQAVAKARGLSTSNLKGQN